MLSAEMAMIVGPAFVAGLMITMTHAPLGIAVLKRGIIFIDLAIAQIAGLGVVAANFISPEPSWWLVQGAALACAVLAALFFHFVERFLPDQQEAIIGCSFVLAASVAILLLAGHPNGGEAIQHLFSGQLLFVTWEQAMRHMPVYAVILALWFLRPQTREGIWFYLLFSVAITSSVQLAGVFVVFASLIAPALGAVRHAEYRPALAAAYAIACAGLISGFAAAIFTDLPIGPVLVCSFMLSALLMGVWPLNWRRG